MPAVEQPGSIQTTIVIPAYNEEEALPHVLSTIYDTVDDAFEVIVVDDGSCDGTRSVAQAFPCQVVAHDFNRGKGAAMRTGIQCAQGEYVVFIDGDATYPVDAIPRMVAELAHHDLVRCTRQEGRDNIPFTNRVGNTLFDRILRVLHRMDGTDFLTGLYGVQRAHLEKMNLESTGFDIETEIAVKAQAMELRSTDIPIEYRPRLGVKKLRPLQDGTKILARMSMLALTLNPTMTFIVPGLILWGIALIVLVAIVLSPDAPYRPNSFIVGVMAFLAGFQLMVFGYEAALYVMEAGLGNPNPKLAHIAERIPRLLVVFLALASVLLGSLWSLYLFSTWVLSGFGPFTNTQSLVLALALVVLGIQMLSTLMFFSLFTTGRAKRRMQQ